MSADTAVHVRRPHDLWMAVGALLVLVGLCWLATAGVSSAEERIFGFFNEQPDWLEQLLWGPMQLGSLFGPLLVAVVAWLVWRDWRPAVGALVAGVVAWQLAKTVKGIIERGRPHSELVDMVRRGGTPTEGLGFVSGHAAGRVPLATVVSPYVRREWRWAPFALAAVVAAARVHVGAHFPLDVVGGAALGCGVAYLWRFAVGVPSGTAQLDRPETAL